MTFEFWFLFLFLLFYINLGLFSFRLAYCALLLPIAFCVWAFYPAYTHFQGVSCRLSGCISCTYIYCHFRLGPGIAGPEVGLWIFEGLFDILRMPHSPDSCSVGYYFFALLFFESNLCFAKYECQVMLSFPAHLDYIDDHTRSSPFTRDGPCRSPSFTIPCRGRGQFSDCTQPRNMSLVRHWNKIASYLPDWDLGSRAGHMTHTN